LLIPPPTGCISIQIVSSRPFVKGVLYIQSTKQTNNQTKEFSMVFILTTIITTIIIAIVMVGFINRGQQI